VVGVAGIGGAAVLFGTFVAAITRSEGGGGG
jgi:hypothetical protein